MGLSFFVRMSVCAAAFLLAVPFFVSANSHPDTQYVPSCPNLSRTLSFGSRGQDVVELQNFLILQRDLAAGNNTGYFGAFTRAAVRQFQCREMQICSGSESTNGYGSVGPKTRAAIARVCAGVSIETPPEPYVAYSAYPQTGSAPLTVNFSYAATDATGYVIEFGDGRSEGMMLLQPPCAPNAKCSPLLTSSHMYRAAGTYTAKLISFENPYPCTIDNGCGNALVPKIHGTVVITVTSGATPTNKAACEAIGGKWETVGEVLLNTPLHCNMPTSDAGKPCTDSSQCQSFCQASVYAAPGTPVSGTCHGWKEASCSGGIKNGVAVPMVCS